MAIPAYNGTFDPGNSIDWKDFAACRGMSKENYDTFYANHSQTYKLAKEICRDCEVREECLEYALLYEKMVQRRFGCYGGMSPEERTKAFGNYGAEETIKPYPQRVRVR